MKLVSDSTWFHKAFLLYMEVTSRDWIFLRTEWNLIKGIKSDTVKRIIVDNTLPDGLRERSIVYEAPFDKCDREEDYEIVWAEFEERFGTTKHW